uniref:Uncharacterized protein n=1 Tax=Timema cristinae TaxID=61476 RepID=A0A7R9D5J3_TIMCR|nr:unnamed protein product [Timema cristinae]
MLDRPLNQDPFDLSPRLHGRGPLDLSPRLHQIIDRYLSKVKARALSKIKTIRVHVGIQNRHLQSSTSRLNSVLIKTTLKFDTRSRTKQTAQKENPEHWELYTLVGIELSRNPNQKRMWTTKIMFELAHPSKPCGPPSVALCSNTTLVADSGSGVGAY